MKKLWNKDFVLLLQGNAISTIGDLMYSVAIGYWVYEQTGSTALMGIMSAISMFVTMILSPFCGSIVDKCNRKWVLVGMDLMQSTVMLTIGVLAYMNKLNTTGVLIAAVLAALGSVFYSPAVSTLMLDIIPRDDMVRGQSVFSSTNSLISMVGTAFSGVLVAFFGVPLIVIINGLSNLYSAITELFIRVPKTVQQGERISFLGVMRDYKTAVKVVFKDRYLKLFIPSLLILNLLASGPFSLILPLCMEKGFTVDMYGYLMSVWTAASLIAAVLLGAIKFKPRARYAILAISFVASVIFLSIAYLSKTFIFVCIFAFVGGLLNAAGNAVFSASMMLALPEENRGALIGFVGAACCGGSALSSVIYGVLCDHFSVYLVFVVGNIISLIPMLWLCLNRKTKEFILSN